MAWIEHDYVDSDALIAAVTAELHDRCASALRQRGHVLLSLAGGRTPLPIYRALATSALEWAKVVVLPGDERCVPDTHAASNVAALREAFAAADGIRIESLTTDDGDPRTSLSHARSMLAAHTEAFDAVVLGMGEDAHTASLFPGADTLAEAMAKDASEDAFLLVPKHLPPEAPFPRITLGLARLLRARSLHLIVTGARKRGVLRAAQTAHDPLRAPISALLHASGTVVHVHWSP
jgi:6-phosphogluconolactonase